MELILKTKGQKYRKSIIKSMEIEYIEKYGFEESYSRFERSINNMAKEGDKAEEMALQFLKNEKLLSNKYAINKIISLNTIKIEADIIDYGNKIIYETKSRRTGEMAKQACKSKWNVFEYDKKGSFYEDYKFYGIIVANYEVGMKLKGIVKFENSTYNYTKQEEAFNKHYKRVELFRSIKRSQNYDELGYYIKKKPPIKIKPGFLPPSTKTIEEVTKERNKDK